MAIGFDAAAAICTNFGGGNLTLNNFTTGSGANRFSQAIIIYEATNTTGVGSTSVTYNGVAMGTILQAIQTNKYVIEAWKLVAPASGSHAFAVAYAGTFQHVQMVVSAFTGVDQTNPVAASNSAAQNAINNANFPTTAVNISGGSYGYMGGSILYANQFEGPADTPSPFGTVDINSASMVGGIPTPGDYAFLSHGAYNGAVNAMSWASHDGSNYDYILAGVSLNAAVSGMAHQSQFFDCDRFAIHAIESCDYGN